MGMITNAIGAGGKLKGFMDKRKKGKGGGAGSTDGSSYAGDSGVTGESFKRGGKVKRTGLAKVHKGEEVLTGKQSKRYKARGAKR